MKMKLTLIAWFAVGSAAAAGVPAPTFHRDVLPILQKSCQGCHRPGEIGPMPLLKYEQVRPWAKAIREAVLTKKMPPWFADSHVGKYANDRSLSQTEIATLIAWADSGTKEGDPKDGPQPVSFTDGWRMGTPDVVFEMSKEFHVPATGTIPYEYIIVPTGFKEDKWVQGVEFRPGAPAVVHHSSIYSREPGSSYAAGHAPGEFFELDEEVPVTARKAPVPGRTMFSSPDFPLHLQVFAPGGDPVMLPEGEARLVKAGSDIIFQVHYTTNGKPAVDRSRIGLIFAKNPPAERVKTVRIQNGVPIKIPPGEANYQLESRVVVQHELKVVSLQPHMHFRGRFFEYSVVYPTGETEVLLRVPRYEFHWQQTYYLDRPRLLPKGTILIAKAGYDNSVNNPNNPDPKAWVKGGAQSWDEMMAGFMDIAFDPNFKSMDFFRDAPKEAGAATVALAGDPHQPTFSKDIAPILQKHCQVCHRPGEVAPMSLLNYSQARPWAKAIRTAVLTKKMPPWFADERYGHFSNDPSLTQKEIDLLAAWVDTGAVEGNPRDLPPPAALQEGWTIGKPDVVLEMEKELPVPARGTLDVMYVVVPTHFAEDRWVQAAEVRPGNRALVHHVNAILRTPDQQSLRNVKPGEPYTPAKRTKSTPPPDGSQPESEFFVGFVPGLMGKVWPAGEAKFVPAGSDFIFQLHYSTNGTAGTDRTKIGLIFAKEPPRQRVLSAVAKNWTFVIPAGDPNHEVRSMVEFASDVTLVSLQPHMHYRGKDYEYRAVYPTGETEVLLRVPRYDFNWQLTYFLEKPKFMPRGTRIECTAHYDNSVNNPHNPDPAATISYGEQSWDEMMSGWMEVAFDPAKNARQLFAVKSHGSGSGE